MSTMAKASKKKSAAGALKIQPLGDRVVVEREAAEERTAGGIVLPDAPRISPRAARSSPSATAATWTTARGRCKSRSATRSCSPPTLRKSSSCTKKNCC